jgi:hypothetical protein
VTGDQQPAPFNAMRWIVREQLIRERERGRVIGRRGFELV